MGTFNNLNCTIAREGCLYHGMLFLFLTGKRVIFIDSIILEKFYLPNTTDCSGSVPVSGITGDNGF